jgi:hypothetical protein
LIGLLAWAARQKMSTGPAWGRWHTKLVWLPSADLVAVRQAAARRGPGKSAPATRAGGYGCGLALGSESCKVGGGGPSCASWGMQIPKAQSVFQRLLAT